MSTNDTKNNNTPQGSEVKIKFFKLGLSNDGASIETSINNTIGGIESGGGGVTAVSAEGGLGSES
jgi:hypothetical protein